MRLGYLKCYSPKLLPIFSEKNFTKIQSKKFKKCASIISLSELKNYYR